MFMHGFRESAFGQCLLASHSSLVGAYLDSGRILLIQPLTHLPAGVASTRPSHSVSSLLEFSRAILGGGRTVMSEASRAM